MNKHLVTGRDSAGDWYESAQKFLADNDCNELELIVEDKPGRSSFGGVFKDAVASLELATGEEITLDQDASIFVVTADLTSGPSTNKCQCQCGIAQTCGGGGGGAAK